MADVFQRLEEEVDPDGLAGLIGLDVQTLLSFAGYAAMRSGDAELVALVEALEGALDRELGTLAGRVRELEQVADDLGDELAA